MMDLTKLDTREFAELINEKVETIRELLRDNAHLGYTNKPYDNCVLAVANATVREDNKEIVAKYLYTNLFNRYEHRFYDTRGYSITLRG